MFESLESRRLTSLLNSTTGVVTVLGKDNLASLDMITVRVSSDRFVVDDGNVHSFSATQVK